MFQALRYNLFNVNLYVKSFTGCKCKIVSCRYQSLCKMSLHLVLIFVKNWETGDVCFICTSFAIERFLVIVINN